MLSSQVDCLFIMPYSSENRGYFKRLSEQMKDRIIFINRYLEDVDIPFTVVDNDYAAEEIIRHVYEQGHRSVTFLDLKDREISLPSPIISPDLLVVFHQALLKDESVWAGCGENTEVIVGLEDGQEALETHFPVKVKKCYGVSAQKIAMESHSRINVVMLGAIARAMGFPDLENVNKICADTLGKKYPDALEGNLKGIRRGFEEVRLLHIQEKPCGIQGRKGEKQMPDLSQAQAREWGYETAPLGGINPCYGNTVVSDLSPSRQGYIPVFLKERCINCGLCDSTCPDMVFQFAKGEYKGREMRVNQGLDYYHCKGCLRCVEVCPVNALVRGLEAEHPQKDYFLPNQALLRMPEYYEKTGADGYVTSESYLTEKRMEGGEV